MKKYLLLAAVAILSLTAITSCKNGGNPKDVANTWLVAFYHMDYEAAKKVSTDETKTLLAQLAQFSGMVPDSTKQQYKKITVNIKDVKENGDKADVTYTISDPTSKEASDKDQMLHLVKQNNKWLVQFSKNDTMGGDDANGPAGDSTSAPGGADSGAAPANENAPADKK